MPYTLHRLAAGSCDLLLDGAVIGGVVRDITAGGDVRKWRAELLDDLPLGQRPQPFTETEHRFHTLDEVLSWLGDASVADNSCADGLAKQGPIGPGIPRERVTP